MLFHTVSMFKMCKFKNKQKSFKKYVYKKEQHILLKVSRKLQKLFKNSFCKDVRE